MRKLLLLICLFVAGLAFGQFSDEQLYKAYMQSDLSLWGKYIDAQHWDQLSHQERKRLINYEYGYIPVLADQKQMEAAANYLLQYNQHLSAEANYLSRADYLAYQAASHAYAYLLDKGKIMSEGLQSFKVSKQAVEADPHNVIALTLKGNVDFYAPRIFGGNKQNAMAMFQEAEQLMLQDTTYRYLWNLPAIQLCIAQCYDYMGDTDAAIEQIYKLLHTHPHFTYAKDVYLPQLKEKKQKK